MGKDKLEMELLLGIEDVAGYLEDLAGGFRAGRLVVDRGDRFLRLEPPAALLVRISASRGKDREKVSVKLSWERRETGAVPLTISADEAGI